MANKLNIQKENLKELFLTQSNLVDSDKENAIEIIRDEGYDSKQLKAEGLSLIKKLKKTSEEKSTAKISWEELLRKVVDLGLSQKLVENRIIPTKLMKRIREDRSGRLVVEALEYFTTLFDISRNEFIESNQIELSSVPYRLAFYKKPTNANINQIRAYSHYAYFIAKASMKACDVPLKDYPSDINEFRNLVLEKHGAITLDALLDTIWDLGICVIPLSDSGVFHGASWNIEGRHVIVLKQKTDSHAKWIFDLLHELYHVFVHLEEKNSSVIEEEELSPVSYVESEEELEANSFANQFIFHENADQLAQDCIERASKRVEKLKQAVIDISGEKGYRADFLANYLAYRLQYEGTNWWGTANNLQIKDPSPSEITKNYLKKKLNFKYLNQIESNMLSMAIN